MTQGGKTAELDQYDRDTLDYLRAFPQVGDAVVRRVELALLRGASMEAKVARVEALAADYSLDWREDFRRDGVVADLRAALEN